MAESEVLTAARAAMRQAWPIGERVRGRTTTHKSIRARGIGTVVGYCRPLHFAEPPLLRVRWDGRRTADPVPPECLEQVWSSVPGACDG